MKNTQGTKTERETEREVRKKAKHLEALLKHTVLGVHLPFGVEVVATALQKIEKTFVLGIMGEFRSGKSTLINALTGLPLALTDVVETTATLNEYRHGDTETAVIVMHDGSSDAMKLSELNEVLGRRRQDHEWLKTVDHVTVTAPSSFLEHLSIWDSPGLSGSVFNENLALQFLERLDVALWVFDLDFLGAQGLQTALDELGRRGTPVVALLNKAEGRSDAEIARAKEYLTQAHDGIQFHRILPLSATRAFEAATRAFEGSEEGGDDAVGPDGGLGKLKQRLKDEVLAEPRLLLVQTAAEDLAVSANTLQRIYEEEASKRRRMLWLLKQQTDGIQSLGEQIVQEASVTVFHGLQQRVLDALSSAFEQEVEVASDQNLRDKKWIARAFDRVLTQERLQTIACDYMKEYEPDLVASWERAVVQAHHEFDSRLTPLDAVSIKESMFEDVPTMNWTWNPQEMPSAFAIVPDTSVTVLALSITKIASPRLAMTVAREFLSASGITLSTPKKNLEARKSRLINLAVTHFANVAREKLCPQVESHLVTPVLECHKQQYCDTMVAVASNQIMSSVPEQTVRNEEIILSKAGHKVAVLTQEFHRLSNAPSRAIRETPLLHEAVKFQLADRAMLERLLERIFSSAIAQLDIADAAFSAEAFALLRFTRDSTPIRLLAYNQPLSATLHGDFIGALTSLQRPGPVRVRVPLLGAEQTCPFPEKGAWIFTDKAAYSLSSSLSRVGLMAVTVTPHSNDDELHELHEEHFSRWWEEHVPNTQALDLVNTLQRNEKY